MSLVGVVVRRYMDFLILCIPTLVSALFCSSIPTFCSFLNVFVLVSLHFCNLSNNFSPQYKHSIFGINTHTGNYRHPMEAV